MSKYTQNSPKVTPCFPSVISWWLIFMNMQSGISPLIIVTSDLPCAAVNCVNCSDCLSALCSKWLPHYLLREIGCHSESPITAPHHQHMREELGEMCPLAIIRNDQCHKSVRKITMHLLQGQKKRDHSPVLHVHIRNYLSTSQRWERQRFPHLELYYI